MAAEKSRYSVRFLAVVLTVVVGLVLCISTAQADPLTWLNKAPLPIAVSRAASGVVNGKLFVLGGATDSGNTTSVNKYDPLTNAWLPKAELSEPRFASGSAVIGDTIYIAGGGGSSSSEGTILAYNTETGASSIAATMSVSRFRTSAAALDGKVYIVGGDNPSNTIEVFDPSTGQSAFKANMPASRERASVAGVNGRLYIIGGIDNNGVPASTCWEFNPNDNSFTEKQSIPVAVYGNTAQVFNGKIYVAGGGTSGGFPSTAWSTDVQLYDPATDSWSTLSAFPTSRYAVSAGIIGNTLYVVGGDNNLTNLATNEAFVLGEPASAKIWSWGANFSGQLGDGALVSRETPLPLPELYGVTAIASTMDSPLMLKADGTVWAWGDNSAGQLGDGTNNYRNAPVQVIGLTGVSAIAGGWFHSLALKPDGTVWAWGRNVDGQLGDGTTENRNTPVQVNGLTSVIAIAGGEGHTLALKSNGTVWALGSNYFGQLGNGTNNNSLIPVQVTGLSDVVAIAAGIDHSLALKADGSVWTWGYYGFDGTPAMSRNTPFQVEGLSEITAIAGGGSHSLAIKADGTVWTWGTNRDGQLGDGSTNDRNTALQVPGLSGVTAITAKCRRSAALKSDGTVWTWGHAYTTMSDIPVQVRGLHSVTGISAGMDQTLALSTSTSENFTIITTSLPAGAVGASYNKSLVAAHGSAPYNWSISPGYTLPSGLSLNAATGVISGTPQSTGTSCFAVQATDVDLLNDTVSLCIPLFQPLVITTSSLPTGVIGVPYSQTLMATGGEGPYTWNWFSYYQEGLPAGLALDAATGVLSGTPTTGGAYRLLISLYDRYFYSYKEILIEIANTPQWTVYSSGPPVPNAMNFPAGSAIDWSASQHDSLIAGSYLQIADVYYLVIGSRRGSWNGDQYNNAVLQQCDQATKQPLWDETGRPLFADMSGLVGAPIVLSPLAPPPGAYPLSVNFAGVGSGLVNVSTVRGSATYSDNLSQLVPQGTVATLTAIADTGAIFNGWTGCDSVDANNVCSVTMTEAKNVTATFESPDVISEGFTQTGSMATPRNWHTATLLPNGKALVVGGYGIDGFALASAERYDPVTKSWSAAGALTEPRYGHTTTLLPNGKVLVTGGFSVNNVPLFTSEIYDPTDNSWTTAANLAESRGYHTATLLSSGEVLVAGGSGINGAVLSSAELYDPAGNSWSAGGSLAESRGNHTATLLSSGKVLVAGGSGPYGSLLPSAELYDPVNNNWSATGSLAESREYHTATLLSSGKVLVAGGFGNTGILATAELYDPAGNSWSTAGSLAEPRVGHSATLLPSGKVLVAGSYANSGPPLASSEIYDPAGNIWTTSESLVEARFLHTATRLVSGEVLVAGGVGNSGPLSSAETFNGSPSTWTVYSTFPPSSGSGSPFIDWLATQHGTLVAGNYLQIAGAYYFVLASTKGSWNGFSYNAALLQQCDQTTKQPLFDANGPILADMSGLEGAAIIIHSLGLIPGLYPLNVTFPGTGNDWVSFSPPAPPGFFQSYNSDISQLYQANTVVNLTPTISSGANFESWVGCDYVNGNVCTVTMNAARSVTANYVPVPLSYPVSVTVNGNGVVHSSPLPDINCTGGTCTQMYAGGTAVELTATPSAGSVFAGWTGCDFATENQCFVTVTAAKNVTATYVASTSHWQQSGLVGLNITGVAVSPAFATDSTLLAGTAGNGIFKSIDGGVTWNPANGQLADLALYIWPVVFSPDFTNDQTLLVGTSNGSYKSTDGGDSWHWSSSGMVSTTIRRIVFSPAFTADHTVFAGTWWEGVFKSTDGGDSWSPVNNGITVLYNLDVDALAVSPAFAEDHTVFAGTREDGIFRSTDGGDSWSNVNTGLGSWQINYLAISPTYASDRTIFAASAHNGIFRSTDGGATWSSVSNGLPGDIGAVVLSPGFASDRTLYATSSNSQGVFRSTDGAATWRSLNDGLTNLNTSFLAVASTHPDNRSVFVGTYGDGIFTLVQLPPGPALSVTITGSGTVHSSPLPDINCTGGTCAQSYANGTSVQLTASPLAGWSLAGWTGCDSISDNVCAVTMNQAKDVTATFSQIATFSLTVTMNGSGEVHSTPPPDINCTGGTCTQSYVEGTSIQLTATPASGFDFAGWTGCDLLSDNLCTVIMNGPTNVVATFSALPATFVVTPTAGTLGSETYQLTTQWGGYGTGNGQFIYPSGMTVDASGMVYVADTRNHRIQKFDGNGNYLTSWGSLGAGDGQFNYPTGVAVDAYGNVYVADYFNSRIQKFDRNGNYLTQWSNAPQYSTFYDLAFDPAGNLYVAGLNSAIINKFDPNGTLLNSWNFFGSGDGQFQSAAGIAVDSTGSFYVSDSNNSRVLKFDANGNFLIQWGSFGTGNGQFAYTSGIAVDAWDNVYVADLQNHRIQKFEPDGAYLTQWGGDTESAGRLLHYPEGVAADSFGNVYVVGENHLIQKFAGVYPGTSTGGGSISPPTPQNVISNTTASFEITPNTGYGISLVSGCGGTLNGTTYTTGPVTADCTVKASFSSIWNVHSAGPPVPNPFNLPANSAIDWWVSLHAQVPAGSYLKIADVFYHVAGSTPDSWSGTAYTAAALQQCDQSSGDPLYDAAGLPVWADTSNMAGQRIQFYASWPAPAGAITINGGAAYAVSNSVSLTLSATDVVGVTQMRFSNDGNIWTTPEGYATSRAWETSPGDGSKTIYVKYGNTEGRWSQAISSSITVDTTAPVVSITSPLAGFTKNNTPQLNYTVSDGAVVVKVDGMVVNNVSGDLLDSLSEGPHKVRVEATDEATNTGFAEVDFTVDTVAPTVVITSPTAGLTNTSAPQLYYTVSDGAVVVKVDGMVVNKVTGNLLDSLSEGPHKVRVEATDEAGNTGSAEVDFSVDTIAPTVAITSPAAGFTNINTAQLSYTASDGAVVVKVDGVVVSKVSGDYLTSLTDGPHVVRIEAMDAAGNLGFAEVTFTVDTATPVIISVDPADYSDGVPLNAAISAFFDEKVQPGSNISGITLKKANTSLPVAVSITGNLLQMTPNSVLTKNTKYTVTIPAGAVNDMAGNALATARTISFTTTK